MAVLMTEREYAHSLGLAKLGRGKFSAEAKAAIAKAKAGGMEFRSTAYVPTGKPRGGRKPQARNFDIVEKSEGEVVVTEPKARPKVSEVRASAPRGKIDKTREQTVMYAISKGIRPGQSDLIIALDTCFGCGRSISYCTHNVPLLPKYLGGGEGMLVKPVLNA